MKQIENLIFNAGFHKCENTDYNLLLDYKVLKISASFSNITEAIQKHPEQVNKDQLILEHCATTENMEESVTFYKSDYTMWNIIHQEIVNRKDIPYTVESERIRQTDQSNTEDILQTLIQLKKLYYKKFKVIDQNTLKNCIPELNIMERTYPTSSNDISLQKKIQENSKELKTRS